MWRLKETQIQTGSTLAAGLQFIAALTEKHIFRSKIVRTRGIAALFTIGGAYRAVGKAVCSDKANYLIGTDNIQHKLRDAASRSDAYYQNHHEESVKDRFAFVAVAAEILSRAALYTDVDNVIFLRKKMTDAMAQRIHKRIQNKHELKAELPQPFCPSNQGQPVLV
jgi:hypothetical protein